MRLPHRWRRSAGPKFLVDAVPIGALGAVGFLLVALMAAGPAAGQITQIDPGIDLWKTDTGAETTVTFPQDFFCIGGIVQGEPVTITLTGEPLVTDRPTETDQTDTIVERLDTAVFDSNGTAVTDIRVRALSMTSGSSVVVDCGGTFETWAVDGVCLRQVSPLEEPQFVTELTMQKGSHGDGGTFSGTLEVPAKLIFTKGLDRRELPQDVSFTIPGGIEPAHWAAAPGSGGLQVSGTVTVDTDCDGFVDSPLPPTSNFHAGWDSSGSTTVAKPVVHENPTHAHPVEEPTGSGGGTTGGGGGGGGGGDGGDEECSRDSTSLECECDPALDFSVSVRPDSGHVGVRNLSLASVLLGPCELALSSVTEGGVDASLCDEANLVVRQDGREKPFRVMSVAPCVLSVGIDAQHSERGERLQRQ